MNLYSIWLIIKGYARKQLGDDIYVRQHWFSGWKHHLNVVQLNETLKNVYTDTDVDFNRPNPLFQRLAKSINVQGKMTNIPIKFDELAKREENK